MLDTILAEEDLPSGRFVLRIAPELHAALRRAADECDLSLNEYCSRKLVAPASRVGGPGTGAVEKAVEVVGSALEGIVAFGSWARDEMRATSDVDVLVVVEDSVPLRRSLYRAWDDSPLRWDGHRVEPHFAHLPASVDDASGLWAEAAVEGVVLFDGALRVSRRLAGIRRAIVAGRIVRRESHGHPYWVKAA